MISIDNVIYKQNFPEKSPNNISPFFVNGRHKVYNYHFYQNVSKMS